jgi:hypothetical protein
VGVWGFANGGYFSNFSYQIGPAVEKPERKPDTFRPGILSRWDLSEAFDVDKIDPEILPSQIDLKTMKWQAVTAEAPGMVVVDRYRFASWQTAG